MLINSDTYLRDVLNLGDDVLRVLDSYGLSCAICMGAEFERVRDVISAHGIEEAELLSRLNEASAKNID